MSSTREPSPRRVAIACTPIFYGGVEGVEYRPVEESPDYSLRIVGRRMRIERSHHSWRPATISLPTSMLPSLVDLCTA